MKFIYEGLIMTKIMTILTAMLLAIVLSGCNTQNNDSNNAIFIETFEFSKSLIASIRFLKLRNLLSHSFCFIVTENIS